MSSNIRLWIFTCLVISTSAQLLNDDWRPVHRRQPITATFHGNAFQQQTIDDRFSKINHLSPFDHYNQEFNPHPLSGLLVPAPEDECGLFKIGFGQDVSANNYNQYVQYMGKVPNLKEFTICMWTKFHNHSNDHPLFTYSVKDHPKAIAAWVSNSERASYYSLSVAGHTFYRLNYPLKPNKWYHSCQSWNGRTGEWQIWVNGERVGRGFHNRLVGHVVEGGGMAITGQEQSQIVDGKNGPRKTAGGMLGEFTMLQLYHVALTAGKAHKDHKHHHVHHFAHDGSPLPLTTAPPPPPPALPPQGNSILIGGQLTPMLELNLGSPQIVQTQLPNGLQLNQQYVNGQFDPGRVISQQLLNSGSQYQQQYQLGDSIGNRLLLTGQLANPANVQFFEAPPSAHNLFKRDENSDKKRNKRDNPENDDDRMEDGKKHAKRGLVALSDGSIVDDSLLTGESFEQSLLNGLAGLGENIPVQNIQKQKVDEREPAEAEVRAVMDICNGCASEPFQKALVLSWRHTPKKLFNGAYFFPAVPACKAF